MLDYHRFIVAALLLSLAAALVCAQPSGQIPNNIPGDLLPAVGPPNVAVTEVKNLGVSGNNLRMQVKWAAQVPNTTKVETFRVKLTVNYASGGPANTAQIAVAAAREIILTVPNRGASNPPQSFNAVIETSFTGIAVQTKTMSNNFTLNQSNGFVDSVKSDTKADRVHKVEAGNNGSDLSRFDVFWSFVSVSKADDLRFSIKGDFVYQLRQEGTPPTLPRINRSATLTAPGSAQQVQFHFPGTPKLTPGQQLIGITANITVTALIKLIQRKDSTPLTGNF